MSTKEGELSVSKKKNQKVESLGQIIRNLREENGLTRDQLSERAALGSRHMAAIESGDKNPSVAALIRLIRSMGISADRVVYPELQLEDDDLNRISRLAATCSAKQRKFIVAFIELVLTQKDLD